MRAPGYTHGDVNRRLGESGEAMLTSAVSRFVQDRAGSVPERHSAATT